MSGRRPVRVLAVSSRRWLAREGPGGYKRQWHIVRGLEANGLHVTVWAFDPEPVAPIDPHDGDLIEIDRELPGRPRIGLINKVASLVSPLPEVVWIRPTVPGLTGEIALHDVVLFLGPACVQLVPQVQRAGRPIALDQDDLPDELIGRIAATVKKPIARWRMKLDARKWARFQARVLARAHLLVAVSERDAERFRFHARGKVVVRPNGVDLDAFAFGDHAAPAGRTLLMTGDFGYLPNVDAARWLTGEIFPAVRRQLPAATLRLVGRSAPTAGLPDGASGTPDVPHIAPYFDDADLFIVPLRAGGGTRLKIVEALAKGLPTVTTSIGAEGLAVQDGEHLLIADTTSSLVEAVTRLLADVDLRRRLARNGRELVERRYGWETIAAAYAADLRALVGGRST